MNDIIVLEPVLMEKIWGGSRLKQFGYDTPSDKTGECWGISGHAHGTNVVANGPYKGLTLRQLWEDHRELFANEEGDEFPLLVKIIDAQDDLSVQVHPDDTYAKEHENYAFGKTECWYILDKEPSSELVLGHNASTREELQQMVDDQEWKALFRSVPVEKGDFVYVPSGTVHAIGKGIMILEIQQSSDITYRFYDYGRKDTNGNERDLHIKDSVACSMVPHVDPVLDRSSWKEDGVAIERLIQEHYFTVHKWDINGNVVRENRSYLLMSVIEGTGSVVTEGGTHTLKKGDHFIIPSTVANYEIIGEMKVIVSETTK
ncbi:mannose-6-phosphate isomerase, class I [Evansella cellulosilytica]|uniref:Mannose-6-phosphate isomerase n=1 Tax=Evansella cellulosilytica (strain ATCC 21833 / DSM 2522 / FERM P-1141 / JCM 9156 / N-4) TaxID=649639 RepID=E6TS68_EVAC2|nr:mannose-6-phosphate isomerase, class I [Evansella cellulosilytica]ADU31837.1 mannose-6-phosphate isomerase, class I [Evansella cellulosilytica DSM 2522]